MLSEGRKRDTVANAILALSFAANAAQSPESLVTSGKTAAPNLPLMGELMRKRKEANRNLDSARVSEPARNRKKKTFKEFVEEATLIAESRGAHFSTREELMKHHGGKLPDGTFIKNRGTKENPKYGLASSQAREKQKQDREERIKKATGQLTPREKAKVETKRRLARERGAEVHHATEIETSAKEMRNMSPGDVLRHKKKQAQDKKYHGNDPRNLVVANKSPVSKFKPQQPGFHHGKYHAFERGNRNKLKDIDNAISPMRAFTTLVNKARKKTRRGED
jgi:hypothetical protein